MSHSLGKAAKVVVLFAAMALLTGGWTCRLGNRRIRHHQRRIRFQTRETASRPSQAILRQWLPSAAVFYLRLRHRIRTAIRWFLA